MFQVAILCVHEGFQEGEINVHHGCVGKSCVPQQKKKNPYIPMIARLISG